MTLSAFPQLALLQVAAPPAQVTPGRAAATVPVPQVVNSGAAGQDATAQKLEKESETISTGFKSTILFSGTRVAAVQKKSLSGTPAAVAKDVTGFNRIVPLCAESVLSVARRGRN